MRVVILLAVIYYVVSQPVTDEPRRLPRELIECCPCPGSSFGGQDMLGRSAADDCPCRLRSADSEGASSLFFPSTVRADRPNTRSNDHKDEQKNLLEPEVGLATSVLQTLREVTEEDYQDALARDAARSADAIPEESARNVVFIVKPGTPDEEDFVSEASNVKEARCIHPLGTALGRMRSSKPMKVLPDIFKFPKPKSGLMYRNLWDMDNNVGASDLRETVVDTDGKTETKPRTPLFNLRTPLKENAAKANEGADSLKPSTIIEKLEQSLKNRPNLFERFNLPIVPKMKIDGPIRQANNNNNQPNDLRLLPSNNNERTLFENGKDNGLFNFSNRQPKFKNLLKLKDVELLPRTLPKRPLFKSAPKFKDLTLSTPQNSEVEVSSEDLNYDSALNEKVLLPKNAENKNLEYKDTIEKNIEEIVPDCSSEVFEAQDNRDAMTSPSELRPIISDNTEIRMVESTELDDCGDLSLEAATSATERFPEEQEVGGGLFKLSEPLVEKSDIGGNDEGDSVFNDTTTDAKDSDLDPDSNIITETKISPDVQQTDTSDSHPLTLIPSGIDDDLTSNDQTSEDKTQSIEPSSSFIGNPLTPKIKSLLPLSDSLSTFHENAQKSFENLKKKSHININPVRQQDDMADTKSILADIIKQEADNVDSIENVKSDVIDEQDNTGSITYNDLQKLSDDLLDLSSNNNVLYIPKTTEPEDDVDNSDNLKKDADDGKQDLLDVENVTVNTMIPVNDSVMRESESKKEKGCRSGFNDKLTQKFLQKAKSVSQDLDTQEMAVEASSPIASSLPVLLDPINLNEKLGLPLNLDPLSLNEKLASPILNLDPLNLNEKLRSSLHGIISQPVLTEDPLNLLRNPVNEVFKLPTLEDLRQRLSSVFNPDERSTEEIFSDEDGDFSYDEPVEMTPAASTANLLQLPSIKPLEDFNIDLFQLNPLSSSQSNFLSKVPRLNMNKFQAKVPIPNNLDLKPVRLESRVGNGKGISGAALTFGGTGTTSRNVKPLKTTSHLPHLGQSLGNLPTLDELRNSLHSSTQNLLGNAPWQPNLDLFKDSNPLGDIESIRRNAEKTMKGIQQRMHSTLNKGNINPLHEKFARPQDLLEDVNDKLKGIHYDLNDRLTSMHDDFMDKVKFKPLISPTSVPTFGTNRKPNNVMTNIRKSKVKPMRLQTSASTLSSQEVDPLNTPNPRNSLHSDENTKRVYGNLHRMLHGAESAPVPTKVEFPNARTAPLDLPRKTITPLSRSSLRQGTENIFPQNIKTKSLPSLSRPGLLKDVKRPSLIKPSPFKNKKVTVTFATTTVSPIPDKFKSSAPFKVERPVGSNIVPERLAASRSNTFEDINPSSNIIAPRTLAQTRPKTNFKTANEDGMNRKNNMNRLNTAWTYDKPKAKHVEVIQKPAVKPLVWPKSNEDSFLAKVKEAMQARLASFEPGSLPNNSKAPKVANEEFVEKTDMAKAASEKNGVVLDEPLKENVSYRCRMVCTREE